MWRREEELKRGRDDQFIAEALEPFLGMAWQVCVTSQIINGWRGRLYSSTVCHWPIDRV